MKFAYFVFPHTGGTYSVFRNLRSGLLKYGIDLHWLGVGEAARNAAESALWASEREFGSVVGHGSVSDRETAQEIIDALEEGKFSGVFVNVLGGRVEANLMRYLPDHLRKIMVVHTITPATYAAARSIRDHVHATVCVSPRIREDLTAHHAFDDRWTVTIPNGVDLHSVDTPGEDDRRHAFKVIFLGRIDDSSKGALWLPDIVRQLPDDVRLTVAGDGPDLPRLRKRSTDLGERIRFLGAVPPAQVGGLLAEHSVFLMPSRYEGYPVALVEAMAAGCVPVASQIRGVTSAIVTHGTDGLLFPIGDRRRAARAIEELKEHPERLAAMSRHAKTKARESFTTEVMAEAYLNLLRRLSQEPPRAAKPLSIQDWSMAGGLQPSLRSYLPVPVKNILRMTRERFLA